MHELATVLVALVLGVIGAGTGAAAAAQATSQPGQQYVLGIRG